MKQILILILCSLFAFEPVYGQRTKELKLTFDRSDFLIDESDGQLSISSAKHPIQYGADTSEPGLPNVIVHVLIGGDEEYSGVRIQFTEMPLYSDAFVRNNPTYRVRGCKEAKEPVKRVTSYTRALYPEENVRYTGTHNVDGYKYITFLVSPFKYQPGLRKLDLLHDISLSIQLKPSKTRVQKAGRAMRDVVKRVVVNGDEMQALYEKPIVNYRNTFSRDIQSGNDPFDYLIITSESQKSAYQKLADWKTRKGVRTKVVTREYLDMTFDSASSINNMPSQEELLIKRAIRHYKNNNDIKYVLIGGDTEIIPSLLCYARYDSIEYNVLKSFETFTPCDLYYACTDSTYPGRFEWNNNVGDHAYGTVADAIDYHPQVNLSRLSTNSFADAEIQVNRIIEYERNPKIEAWQKRFLMVGNELVSTDNTWRPKSDVEDKGDSIWPYIVDVWQEYPQRFRFYDTRTDHPDDENYELNAVHLKEQFSKGYPFIHIDTHGSSDSISLENGFFGISDAHDFRNPFYSIIFTSVCSTDSIGRPECLGEAFMRNPNGGIIGYWGHSVRVVGADDETGVRPLDVFNIRFYEKLFQAEDPRFGEVSNMVKLSFISEYDQSNNEDNMPYINPYRMMLFDVNPLGDPEMPIYTEQPQRFYYRDLVFFDDEGFKVRFTDDVPTKVCIMSLNDCGETYYQIDDINIPYHSDYGLNLSTLPQDLDYSICFTRPGYVPYILNLYNSGTIQNDTIANDAVLWSDQAKVGYDVDSSKASGPVVIEKGDVFIKAPQGTTIKNHFTLKKGATLTIDPSITEVFDGEGF